MFENGLLNPKVCHGFALDEFNEAINTGLGRYSIGKVVLEP
jgi:hypothetical protein